MLKIPSRLVRITLWRWLPFHPILSSPTPMKISGNILLLKASTLLSQHFAPPSMDFPHDQMEILFFISRRMWWKHTHKFWKDVRWNMCRLVLSIFAYFYLPCLFHLFCVCVNLDCKPFGDRNKTFYTKHHQYIANNNDDVAGTSIISLLLSSPIYFS